RDDPEGCFQGAHIADRPDASFQFIAGRILDGYKLRELSAELDIPVPTLSSFYQRNQKRFAPKLRDYLTQ
ncbi:MAG: sigma-70 family RNA polymerase sigma factor, partial [Rhodospirillales bacterium]|nr:sigma-70 family RNA polymerase sigma factor [Rhodospirillales bacterium]